VTPSGVITVRIPAEAGHVPLLRTAVAGVAARQDFTLEEVDDLRMGVEEAAVLLLRRSASQPIELHLEVTGDGLDIRLETVIDGDEPAIDTSSFSWTILSALVDEVASTREGNRARIALAKRRTQGIPA